MGKIKPYHFHDFWISGPVGPLIYLWIRIYQNSFKIWEHENLLENNIFANIKMLGFICVDFCWKKWGPTNDEDPSNKFLKILD